MINESLYVSWLRLGALSACLIGNGAFAGPNSPEGNLGADAGGAHDSIGQLAEIVVTAQKREERLTDVGVTVAAVSGRQLQDLGITDITQLGRVVSSFHVSTGYDGLPSFSIRGLGFQANQIAASPTVSVYVDEAPLPYSVMVGGTTLDIERVEVLKGPQGTLFGNNSTGGSINFIAAKPTKELSAGMTTSIDRFSRLNGEVFISGPVTSTVNARLSVGATEGGNWQRTYTPGPFMENGEARKGVERLQLDWRPTDALKVAVVQNAYYDDSDPQMVQLSKARPSGGPGSAYVDPVYGSIENYPLPPRSDRAADFAHPGNQHTSFYQGVIRADYQVSDPITLTSLTNYAHLNTFIARPFDGTRIDIIDGSHAGTIKTYGEELRMSGDFKEIRLHVIAGGNYSYSNILESNPFTYKHFETLPPFLSLDAQSTFASRTSSVFANAEWEATDRLTLLGGARYTVDRQTESYCLPASTPLGVAFLGGLSNLFRSISGLPATNAFDSAPCITLGPAPEFLPFAYNDKSTDHNISWRGGVNYHLTPDFMLYGLISRGYKAGGYPFQTSIISSQLNKVQQEEVTAYEAGVKSEWAGKLTVAAAAFYYNYRNKQVFADTPVPPLGPVSILANIPKSKAYGIDAEATMIPIRGLKLHAAINYTHSSITDPGSLQLDGFGAPIDYSGHPFPYAPKISAVFDAEYRAAIGDHLEGFIGFDGSYEGQQTGDLSTEREFNIPGFALFGARVGIETSSGWTASVWMRNIANKFYWTDVNYGGDAYFRTTGLPRNVGATVSYRF